MPALESLPRGGLLALALAPDGSAALAWGSPDRPETAVLPAAEAPAALTDLTDLADLERDHRPRWVWWDGAVPARLVAGGLRPATCWDLAAAHRLLAGGWAADPARIWAVVHDLPIGAAPQSGQLTLDALGPSARSGDDGTGGDAGDGDPESPVGPDGYLRPEWIDGGWARTPDRARAWAALALTVQDRQSRRLARLPVAGDPLATARSESAAALLCAELEADGLPVDLDRARELIAAVIGPAPRDGEHAAQLRRERDQAVLALAPTGAGADLRNPAQVRALLARVGIEVPDTRSWRLEPYRGTHPLIDALLAWRKAERIATTYGYGWLARHVGPDARLRGAWTASDGAAGRMTAQAGLHNLPAELRPAIAAPAGHVLVRADLGQIEPRVLAVVSGDPALARATQDDDLYLPVARRLGVPRATAKVAVLAAMYGQTSGAAGQALKGLDAAYPTAMGYLRAAYEQGRAGSPVRTHGGRLVRVGPLPPDLDEDGVRAALGARGRYVRNAVVQGAAAELFKAWAATVRTRTAGLGARIVLCLHDEPLVQAPEPAGAQVAQLVEDSLHEAAARLAGAAAVRFVADVSVLRRWSDAKG